MSAHPTVGMRSPPRAPTAATPHRVQVELSYGRAGSRLRQIGDLQISYNWGGTRPKALGQAALDYDMAGKGLRHVGAVQVDYDKLGSRPARFGEHELAYDKLGSRLIRIGNLGVDYDMAGMRVRGIGDLTVDYDPMGTRPRYVRAQAQAQLTDQMCVIVFLDPSRVQQRRLRGDGGSGTAPARGGKKQTQSSQGTLTKSQAGRSWLSCSRIQDLTNVDAGRCLASATCWTSACSAGLSRTEYTCDRFRFGRVYVAPSGSGASLARSDSSLTCRAISGSIVFDISGSFLVDRQVCSRRRPGVAHAGRRPYRGRR